MKTITSVNFFIALLLTLCSRESFAQQPAKTATFKPPIVKTYLGNYSDTARVEKEVAYQLIGLPLRIKDTKGNEYKVRYYQFVYRRKDSVENFKTGKPEVEFNTVGQSFYETPLSKVWVDNIRRQLDPGEEFYFFDVMAEDASHRTFYAPALKILIK